MPLKKRIAAGTKGTRGTAANPKGNNLQLQDGEKSKPNLRVKPGEKSVAQVGQRVAASTRRRVFKGVKVSDLDTEEQDFEDESDSEEESGSEEESVDSGDEKDSDEESMDSGEEKEGGEQADSSSEPEQEELSSEGEEEKESQEKTKNPSKNGLPLKPGAKRKSDATLSPKNSKQLKVVPKAVGQKSINPDKADVLLAGSRVSTRAAQPAQAVTRTEGQKQSIEVSSQKTREDLDKCTLFVKNVKKEDVLALSDDIIDFRFRIGGNHKVPFPMAFLEFQSEAVAEKNYRRLSGKSVKGSELYVDYVGTKSLHKTPHTAPETEADTDPKKLFVTGLGSNLSLKFLQQKFPKAANIAIPSKKRSSEPLGFAFVNFPTEALAKQAHDAAQSQSFVVVYGKKGKKPPKVKSEVPPQSSGKEQTEEEDSDDSEGSDESDASDEDDDSDESEDEDV